MTSWQYNYQYPEMFRANEIFTFERRAQIGLKSFKFLSEQRGEYFAT